MSAKRALVTSAAMLLLLAAVGCAPAASPQQSVSPSPAASPPPQPGAVATGLPAELCDFTDPTVPKANPDFPFEQSLSDQTRLSGDPQVVAAVRSIQQVLLAERFADETTFVVDGDYGPQTAAAVRRFQQQAGVAVDGKVGQETWSALAGNCWKYH